MDIEEEVSRLLCLEDPAAEEPAAYDLEGIDQGVLHIFQFKFRQMLYVKPFKDLGRILLHQHAVLIPVIGRQKGGVGRDGFFHNPACLLHIIEFFIEFHHGEQVVHGREGCIQLIVHHIVLLCCQRVCRSDRFRVPLLCGFSSALLQLFFIELRNLFRRPALEYFRGSETGKFTLSDQ